MVSELTNSHIHNVMFKAINVSLDSVSLLFSSLTQLCPTLCHPMDCSTPGFHVLHLPELVQTHVHWGTDAIQPSYPLLSPPAFSLSQHQGLFQWVSQLFTSAGQSIGVSASASVQPMSIQDWSPLGWTGWISLQTKGLSRIFSNTTVQKHQFFSPQLCLQSSSHIHIYFNTKVILIIFPSWREDWNFGILLFRDKAADRCW